MRLLSTKAPRWSLFSAVLCVLLFARGAGAEEGPPRAAIASAHPLATDAGFEILAAGGNAFDAAVAVSAVLAVVEPYSAGLGGGGFWLLHRASDGRELMLDGRERAPLAAHRDMYLDADGRFVPELALNGPLAAGIPGQPAALVHLAETYGRLPLVKSLAPAIRLRARGLRGGRALSAPRPMATPGAQGLPGGGQAVPRRREGACRRRNDRAAGPGGHAGAARQRGPGWLLRRDDCASCW